MSRFQFSLAIFSQSCQHISALKGSPLNKQSCWVLNCLWLIRSKDEGIEQERKSPSDWANATRPTLMWVEPEHAGETRISLGPAMFCLRLCSCQNNVGISLYPDTWPWRVGRGHSYFLTPSYSSLFTQWLFFFLTGLKKKKKKASQTQHFPFSVDHQSSLLKIRGCFHFRLERHCSLCQGLSVIILSCLESS